MTDSQRVIHCNKVAYSGVAVLTGLGVPCLL